MTLPLSDEEKGRNGAATAGRGGRPLPNAAASQKSAITDFRRMSEELPALANLLRHQQERDGHCTREILDGGRIRRATVSCRRRLENVAPVGRKT